MESLKSSLNQHLKQLTIFAILWISSLTCYKASDSYENVNNFMTSKLRSGTYNPDLRPVANQTDTMNVWINFALTSLVRVDDVEQMFTLNGFLSLEWNDQRIQWNPDDYGGVDYLTPQPKHIWRPRILLWNTLSDRDLFKDDFSPLRVRADGSITWNPGGLFMGACALNMEKYPFDEQWCYIRMCPMSHYWTKLEFVPTDDQFDLSFYSPSEGWDLIETKVSIVRVETDVKTRFSSCPNFSFRIKRRPTFFIFNIILPVIVLSFLNNMLYIIPNESGEKISYGITVLLSLSMFLTTVSTMVPQASDHIPLITIYLFVLMMNSVLSVLASMIIVYLHHASSEEDNGDDNSNTTDSRFFKRFFSSRHSTSSVSPVMIDDKRQPDSNHSLQDPMMTLHPPTPGGDRSFHPPTLGGDRSMDIVDNNDSSRPGHKDKYRVLCKHINRAGFITSMIVLVIVNIVFMFYLQDD